jgi:RNA polymerase sigma-70 factor (ECF subfamily)
LSVAQTRDSERFIELLAQHESQLFGYLFALTHNLEDARDLFQQTSLVMWKKFAAFEAGTNFGGWACQVARFEAMNFLRAKRRSRALSDDTLVEELANVVAREEISLERQQALSNCLGKLPIHERQLVDLCYGPRSAIKDVAEQLGRSSQSICNSLRRIREKLFECVDRTLSAEDAT